MADGTNIPTITQIAMCINLRIGNMIPSCGARGSRAVFAKLKALSDQNLLPCELEAQHCMGHCHEGPTIRLFPSGDWVLGVKPEETDEFVTLLRRGDIIALTSRWPGNGDTKEKAVAS